MNLMPSERLDAGNDLDPSLSPRNQAEYDAVTLLLQIQRMRADNREGPKRIYMRAQREVLEQANDELHELLNDIWRNDA